MLKKIPLEHILFLDIETVPEERSFDQLDKTKQELWSQKSQYQRKDDISAAEFYERAGIWAEFGKNYLYFSRIFYANRRKPKF